MIKGLLVTTLGALAFLSGAAQGDKAGPQGEPIETAIKQLADPDARVRHLAAEALGELGDKAAPAIPALARVLGDSEPAVRRVAANALVKIGPRAARALGNALKDQKEDARMAAVQAMRHWGLTARRRRPTWRLP